MDKPARRRIEKAFGGKRALRAVEPMLDGYIVVGGDKVITVAHRQCRLKRHVNAERIAYFLGRKEASELSTKTRADRIDALRGQLQAFYAIHTSGGRA